MSIASAIPTQIPRSIPSDTVSPEQFYSSDDAGDWRFAFERASLAAKIIRPRATTYEFGQAARLSSNTTIIGQGSSTIIHNLRTTQSNFEINSAFLIGDMHPAALNYASQGSGDNLPCHDIADVTQGATSVTLDTESDNSNYYIGRHVFVRTQAENTFNGFEFPTVGQFNIVTGVSGATISLLYPSLYDITTACISPIGDTIDTYSTSVAGENIYWHMLENVHVRDLAINAEQITQRTGGYNCSIRNVSIINARHAIAANAMVRWTIDNCTFGDNRDRIVEIKCYSDTTTISNCTGTIVGDSGAWLDAVSAGEGSTHITFSDSVYTGGAEATEPHFMLVSESSDVTFDNVEVVVETGCGITTPLMIYSTNRTPVDSVTFQDCTVTGDTSGLARYIRVGATGTQTYDPTSVLIDGCTFTDATTESQSIWIQKAAVTGSYSNNTLPYPVTNGVGANFTDGGGNTIVAP